MTLNLGLNARNGRSDAGNAMIVALLILFHIFTSK